MYYNIYIYTHIYIYIYVYSRAPDFRRLRPLRRFRRLRRLMFPRRHQCSERMMISLRLASGRGSRPGRSWRVTGFIILTHCQGMSWMAKKSSKNNDFPLYFKSNGAVSPSLCFQQRKKSFFKIELGQVYFFFGAADWKKSGTLHDTYFGQTEKVSLGVPK